MKYVHMRAGCACACHAVTSSVTEQRCRRLLPVHVHVSGQEGWSAIHVAARYASAALPRLLAAVGDGALVAGGPVGRDAPEANGAGYGGIINLRANNTVRKAHARARAHAAAEARSLLLHAGPFVRVCTGSNHDSKA